MFVHCWWISKRSSFVSDGSRFHFRIACEMSTAPESQFQYPTRKENTHDAQHSTHSLRIPHYHCCSCCTCSDFGYSILGCGSLTHLHLLSGFPIVSAPSYMLLVFSSLGCSRLDQQFLGRPRRLATWLSFNHIQFASGSLTLHERP